MTAKTKTVQPGAAHSAPDAPPHQPAGETPGRTAGGATAAVWAALTANPGATAAQIATAARTSRPIAGRELAALQAVGRATRTPGAGIGHGTPPATWHPVTPHEPDVPEPATGAGHPPAGDENAGDGRLEADRASQAPAGQPETASPAAESADPGARDPATAGHPGADSSAASGAGADDNATGAAPGQTEGGSDAGYGPGSPGAEAGEGGHAPGGDAAVPAAYGDAAQLLEDLSDTASRAASALRDGQIAGALPAIEAISSTAAQARRLLRSAVSGRKARGGQTARPGQLRDLVRAHLAAYPDAEFTPHAIGRVLGRSSGAVANALDRLTALGQAQLTSDHPRRYKAEQTVRSYLAA